MTVTYKAVRLSERFKRDEMAAKFEIFKRCTRGIPVPPKGNNGEIIAGSEGYKSEAAAENGIKSVQTNAPGATVADKTG
jgi:uncharacterized protein YegP (UPF0339 family)